MMKLSELHESRRAVNVTPYITAGSATCDKLFGNAAVTPRSHNVGAYIVATFPDAFPFFRPAASTEMFFNSHNYDTLIHELDI